MLVLSRIREYLVLALLALLPFHALFVTAGTRVLVGPGHAPLGLLAAWKEALLLVALCCALLEVAARLRRLSLDALDAIALAFLAVGGAWFLARPDTAAIYGVKYDMLPIVVFLVLRRVSWSEAFARRACATVLMAGIATGVYGIATLRLPMSFFRWLGYADLHSLYVPSGPLPPFHQIGASMLRRMQAGFAGPNQMGLWLLLPWGVAWAALLRAPHRRLAAIAVLPVGLAIAGSLSRAAWIGGVLVVIVLFAKATAGAARRRVLTSAVGMVVLATGAALVFAPSLVVRLASSADHLRRPADAVLRILAAPLGSGLGTAGPTSNRMSDTCVDVPAGADASWAAAHPTLCVFVGGKQVQPAAACDCPVLPENWYLQIGVELGIAGMALFTALVVTVLLRLRRQRGVLAEALFAAFLACSVGALVLHAWEDAAVALSMWVLVACACPSGTLQKPQGDAIIT